MSEKKRDWKNVITVLVMLVVFTTGYFLGTFLLTPPEDTNGIEETLDVIQGTVFPYTITIYDPEKVYESRLVFTLEKVVTHGRLWNGSDASSKYISGAYVILMDENYTVRKFLGNYGSTELGDVYLTRVAEWVDPADVGSNTSAMVSWLGTRGAEISKRPRIHTWDLETDEITDYAVNTHHDYQIINNTIFHFVIHRVEVGDISQKWDSVVQSDMDGNVLWEYNTSKCIDASWSTGGEADPTHLNSLHFDGETVYVNARNCDTFFAIDYEESSLLYGVGAHGDFTMLEGSQWRWSHSYVKLNETDFLMFDNLSGEASRIIHNRLNFGDMTCELIMEWVLSEDLTCGHWGKVQQLPNNNILVTAGVARHSAEAENIVGGAILEYTQDGELIMKIQFPVDWGICQGAYKEIN